MRKKITLALIFVFLISVFKVQSQNSQIMGKMVDYETNQILVGVTIIPDSVQNGTVSGLSGNFELNGNTRGLEMYLIGYYPLKFLNLPTNQIIDFNEVKLITNHLLSNVVIGETALPITKEMKQKDKKARKVYLRRYRMKIFGKKYKPYFDGKYMVINFNDNSEK